jgi:hypothetical protein
VRVFMSREEYLAAPWKCAVCEAARSARKKRKKDAHA